MEKGERKQEGKQFTGNGKCVDGLRGARWRISVRNTCRWKDKEKFEVERNNWFWSKSNVVC